jgi:hypothetical protein
MEIYYNKNMLWDFKKSLTTKKRKNNFDIRKLP